MKILLCLLFSLTGFTAFAKNEASKKFTERKPTNIELKELSQDSARILEVLYMSCPEKLGELMKEANSIGKVFYGEKQTRKGTQWRWHITGIQRTPAPSMKETQTATLVINWQSKVSDGPVAADQGPEWDIKCSIERPMQ